MDYRVIEKRDDDTTIAVLENTTERLIRNEPLHYNETIKIDWESSQNPIVNNYLIKNNEKKSLVVKPSQKDIKSNNSLENKSNYLNKNLNVSQSDQTIMKSKTLPTNQTPKKQTVSQTQINLSKREPEHKVKSPNAKQKIKRPKKSHTNQSPRKSNTLQKQIDLCKTQVEKTVKNLNTTKTPNNRLNTSKISVDLNKPNTTQSLRNPISLPTNQSPRKQNSIDLNKTENEHNFIRPNTTQTIKNFDASTSKNSVDLNKTEIEHNYIRPNTTRTVRSPSALPTNQSPRKQNSIDLNKTEIEVNVIKSNESAKTFPCSKIDFSLSTNIIHSNQRRKKIFKRRDLLPPRLSCHDNKLTLVLDLDETLVHSVFQPLIKCDFSFKADSLHFVSVRVRPGVKDFIVKMGNLYELVLFTVGNNVYATRIIDFIDPQHMIKHRLFRDSCTFSRGNFVKDLSRLGRDLDKIIILDDSPASYRFQPYNALPISSWIGDPKDNEISKIQKFLTENHQANNVYNILFEYRSKYMIAQNNK